MKITVMHKHHEIEDGLTIVAEVKAPTSNVDDALEYAFRWTQNISGSWSKKIGDDTNNRVEVLDIREDGLGLRSTSVGDRMMFKDTEYEVASFGFEEVRDINKDVDINWESI